MTNLQNAMRQLIGVVSVLVVLAVVATSVALAKPPAHVEAKHTPAPVAVEYEYDDGPQYGYGHPECWLGSGPVKRDHIPAGHRNHDPDLVCS